MKADKPTGHSHPQQMTLVRLFPSILTLTGLCIGMSTINFALKGNFEMAVTFIVLASIIDGMDGTVARLLNATSDFGAQLDSLTDFINFGIAPAFVMYLWAAAEVPKIGWAMVLFMSICCAIRLARFNTDLDVQPPKWAAKFYTGMPSPAGAMMAVGPITVTLALKEDFPDLFQLFPYWEQPWFVIGYVAVIALLMASRLPTYSIKKFSFPRRYAWLILVLIGLVLIAAFTKPFLTLVSIGVWYSLSLPIGLGMYLRAKSKGQQG